MHDTTTTETQRTQRLHREDFAENGRQSVTIKMSPLREVRIEAHSSTPADSWSFRNAYAGVLGIAERITDFRAATSSEQDAGAKKIATGEFRSELLQDWESIF